MYMSNVAESIDSKAGTIALASADRNRPDYKTPTYKTDFDNLTYAMSRLKPTHQTLVQYLHCAKCGIEKPKQEMHEVLGQLRCHRC